MGGVQDTNGMVERKEKKKRRTRRERERERSTTRETGMPVKKWED
jgi:hypothetical protein